MTKPRFTVRRKIGTPDVYLVHNNFEERMTHAEFLLFAEAVLSVVRSFVKKGDPDEADPGPKTEP